MNPPTKDELNQRRAMIGDVPLDSAMLVWNRPNRGGGVLVVPCPDVGKHGDALWSSDCACTRPWQDCTNNERLLWLLVSAWDRVTRDGLDAKDIHEALMVIPEYRDGINNGFPILGREI